jgi:hypothetical protein
MAVGSFLFLKEQIKDIIITSGKNSDFFHTQKGMK